MNAVPARGLYQLATYIDSDLARALRGQGSMGTTTGQATAGGWQASAGAYRDQRNKALRRITNRALDEAVAGGPPGPFRLHARG